MSIATAPFVMAPETELLLQQICDSVFPIGAYSHSYGLETYIQLDRVRDVGTAWEYLASTLRYPLTNTELLGMRLSYERAAAGLGEDGLSQGAVVELAELEAHLSALKVPAETRTASEKLAARFIRTTEGLGVLGEREAAAYRAYAAARPSHAVNAAYGVFGALAGMDLEHLLHRYLYAQVSALVVTCVKSVPLSQTAGQELIIRSVPLQVAAVEHALTAGEELLGLSMPGFDVRCIEHESLYSRLYMS